MWLDRWVFDREIWLCMSTNWEEWDCCSSSGAARSPCRRCSERIRWSLALPDSKRRTCISRICICNRRRILDSDRSIPGCLRRAFPTWPDQRAYCLAKSVAKWDLPDLFDPASMAPSRSTPRSPAWRACSSDQTFLVFFRFCWYEQLFSPTAEIAPMEAGGGSIADCDRIAVTGCSSGGKNCCYRTHAPTKYLSA